MDYIRWMDGKNIFNSRFPIDRDTLLNNKQLVKIQNNIKMHVFFQHVLNTNNNSAPYHRINTLIKQHYL